MRCSRSLPSVSSDHLSLAVSSARTTGGVWVSCVRSNCVGMDPSVSPGTSVLHRRFGPCIQPPATSLGTAEERGRMDKQRDFVLRTIEERGVKFVRLWFTDVVGTLKSVALAPAEVEGAFNEGVGFDGSAIEGLSRTYEADVLAHPDPTTFQILPWRGEIDPTARMFCDITTPDGQPAAADPRNVLKRALAKAADRGFTFYTHPEIEFYLLKSSKLVDGVPE